MCGIAGYWSAAAGVAGTDLAAAMSDRLAHRGPDDAGAWIDSAAGIAIGHRRLAILDLSPAGHQPMISPCSRFVLAYNGEIYNHVDLRAEIEAEGGGFDWRGHSDTETLLAAIRHWGMADTLPRLNGMFALALWDRADRVLWLARDRLGEKPLYYGRFGKVFLFGSELKALSVHPGWRGEVDRDALTLFLRYGYVPAPFSIWRGIAKLAPAHYLAVRDGGLSVTGPLAYWRLPPAAPAGPSVPDEGALTLELETLLRDAVRRRMAADVPLGAFLSGGVDSSTVVALMQSESSRPVRTFSIGFREGAYDESPFARAVANHLGTDHTELTVTAEEAMAVIPELPAVWDEPFADSSQIPTLLLSRLARRHVTVSLTGDGGDELFCGYTRYTSGYQVWRATGRLPVPLREVLGVVLEAIPADAVDRFAALLPRGVPAVELADRIAKLALVVAGHTGDAYYQRVVSLWQSPETVVRGGRRAEPALPEVPSAEDVRDRMMGFDLLGYLPDDILVKVDRATMAAGLEARVPLLDHRVVAFARSLPISLKVRNGRGKWLLRRVLHRHVPEALTKRPKMGFALPIGAWLAGPLKGWAEELLAEERLRREGFFEPALVRRLWIEHCSGTRRRQHQLWSVLMFQAWLDALGRTGSLATTAFPESPQ